ncbi:MAG: NAD/NADP octopine/nopaline dehydrogenase family protein, partial [Oscillospiraceae bacterium]|nr:NAD/NADP octopine/nopaline dehydrogenase family protein [Oscillospiraceae bacterium]
EHYESETPHQLTEKIRSIKAFKGLKIPAVAVSDGLIPDLHSRYFTADFSYGLSVIVQIAHFAGTDVPELERVLNWYNGIRIETDEFRYEDYGIRNTEDFLKFYSL